MSFAVQVSPQVTPVHVTVAVATDWPTTVIAVAGFVLALASLGWQFYTWKGSGSRVRVTARFGIFPAQVVPGGAGLPADYVFYPGPEILAAMRPQGYPRVMLVAEIQNRGRLPVTVQSCLWQTGAEAIGSPNRPPGTAFPHRLGEHDQCISVIDLKSVMGLVDAPNRSPASKGTRQVRPVIQLGNGRTVRGKPIEIPATTEAA
jgi:hypothetical protein